MSIFIRKLNKEDFSNVLTMQTGIEDDYILPIFSELIIEPNVLYGLFLNRQLVSFAGYTIFANQYAMLGRLRSDLRYRGKGFATRLMSYVVEETQKVQDIKWIGANTQENNLTARRVLEKIGLHPYPKKYGAITQHVENLVTGSKPWTPIHDIQRKREWINKVYVRNSEIFPYECYYLFPATDQLFNDNQLNQWSFYENDHKTRFLITKQDQKGDLYLHTIYPWDDIDQQTGLWETIANDFKVLKQESDLNTCIWMDLSPESVKKLPLKHTFELSSPWILYGKDKKDIS